MSDDGLILESIAAALEAVRLDAVVVGNTASELHGAPVSTEDVDLLVRDTRLNRQKIARFAEELGGTGLVDLSDLTQGKRIYLPEAYVDFVFDKLSGGLTFNQVKANSERMRIGAHSLTVASLEDVIRSKKAAGRKKDLAVLPVLEETLEVKTARATPPRPRRR